VVVHLKRQLLFCFLFLGGGSPYNTNSFLLLFCILLPGVVHLKHKLFSSPFLLSSSWWWFTLNINSFPHLFCFLFLGGGSP
jgi:hypothetical protein